MPHSASFDCSPYEWVSDIATSLLISGQFIPWSRFFGSGLLQDLPKCFHIGAFSTFAEIIGCA